ncbi:hypothetical protein LOK49_LG08G01545 [Camellia lanceoleosa]|uniref:Uncharacterized protein n=1 Tax=Camellia lanceoleosa TaxID=1840588 RepID=A0ACC0GSL6_9ERIC|nr:hypothetical protein LOK49_LG08G01545 [Camellia lanceoleosa]
MMLFDDIRNWVDYSGSSMRQILLVSGWPLQKSSDLVSGELEGGCRWGTTLDLSVHSSPATPAMNQSLESPS